MEDSIIIGFSTHRKFNILSWLICKVLKTDFSHVYVKWYSSKLDRWLIYQASGLKVNFVGQPLFLEDNKPVAEFLVKTTAAEKTDIMATAVDLAGKPYGMKQLIGMAWVYLCHAFGKRVRNPYSDGSKTFICSELAAAILVKLGTKIEDLDSISPKDLYDILRGK